MPGRGSYGTAGKWVHDRAQRIMESSPETPKSMAYAVATQQGHKVGKSLKKHRTGEGVASARAKYRGDKSMYQKTASLSAFFDELEHIEKEAGRLKNAIVGLGMLGAVGTGGAKVLASRAPSTLAKTRPNVVQVAKKALKSKGPRIGSSQLKNREVADALRF